MSRQRVSTNGKEIRYSHIASPNDSFFKSLQLDIPQPKETITMRVDKDILAWLKKQGPGYQTRINKLLRQYMEAVRA